MKRKAYFTPANIASKSQSMLDEIATLRARHGDIALHPERAALLVLDMQNYFLQPDSHAFIPSAPAILPNIQRLITAFETRSRPVVFTRHLNTDANTGMMSRWWRDVIRADSPRSQIVPSLDSTRGLLLVKSQYDAFYNTELNALLQGRGVEQVIVTGVMTHLCCETTARSAFVRGYEVFFCIDGTATYTEKLQRASLLNLAHGFSIPALSDEILEKI